MAKTAYYSFQFGILKIEYEAGAVVYLGCTNEMQDCHQPSALSDDAFLQIEEYLRGSRRSFDFPYLLKGTDFQKSVWQELCNIPYGQIKSYKEIAAAIGKPSAVRAVGRACGQNPIWIAVPCHRVVGANGSLTGYAGGVSMKQKLLELEKQAE